jgi:hypothetical protein
VRGADKDIGLQLAAIANLSMPNLLEQWHALGLREPPRLPLPLLQRLLAQLVQEQMYGGLPASAMRTLDAVVMEFGKEACAVPSASSKHSACPTGANPSFSSSPPVPSRALHPSRPSPLRQVTLATGTRLVREWNGRTISVDVVGDGFVWNDVRYRSLSEIARTVTGTRWSGPRFFGIAGRG